MQIEGNLLVCLSLCIYPIRFLISFQTYRKEKKKKKKTKNKKSYDDETFEPSKF